MAADQPELCLCSWWRGLHSPPLQLFNGSYTNIMKQFGVDELRKRVEKFFSRVRGGSGCPHAPASSSSLLIIIVSLSHLQYLLTVEVSKLDVFSVFQGMTGLSEPQSHPCFRPLPSSFPDHSILIPRSLHSHSQTTPILIPRPLHPHSHLLIFIRAPYYFRCST